MSNQDNKLRKLMAAGQVLAKYDSLDQLLPKLLRLSLEVTDAEAASILLYDPKKDVLRFASAINDVLDQEKLNLLSKGLELPMGQGVAGWVADKRTPLNVPDVRQDKRFAPVADTRSGFETKNILCVPVLHGQELLGVAQVLNSKNKPYFDDADQDLLEAFADLAAVALSRSKLKRDMEEYQLEPETSCWKTIGYLGDKSCPSLEKYVHCHNCPVFVRAGHSLLDRDLPEGYTLEWSGVLSKKKKKISSTYSSAAVFRVSSELLGLESVYFEGVFDVRPIRKLPHKSDNTFLGLSVVHGKIAPCISLGNLMGISNGHENNQKTNVFKRFIFVNRGQDDFVIPVDEMKGIIRFEPGETSPVPDTVLKSTATYTRAVLNHHGYSVGLLEPDLFFNALQRSLK